MMENKNALTNGQSASCVAGHYAKHSSAPTASIQANATTGDDNE